ncbi:MAG: NAD(P)H-hydrate dehydratase, partial [Chitinophagaceae bacterium]
QKIFKPRNTFSNKGNFGHALLLAGSYGKVGAAVLCAKACSHAGAGLVTVYLPTCGIDIVQAAIPEVMCMTGKGDKALEDLPVELAKYQSIGVGPGIGKDAATADVILKLLNASEKPLVIDADALNIISENPGMLKSIPQYSILTPHPKEFERLFGKTANEFERIALAVRKSVELKLVIVLKGHHTQVSLPNGDAYFNNTGNSGMAKGGSGDVLTGIITSLLSQGYEPTHAAIFGVHLHGLAGDLASADYSEEAMLPGDLVSKLGSAFTQIKKGI